MRTFKILRACVLSVVVAAAAACSGTRALSCPEGTEPFVEYQLFMGRGGPGEVVDDAAWDAFLDGSVTPRFPDGLTVLDAQGQWRGSDGAIKQERSKLLVILAPPGGDARRMLAVHRRVADDDAGSVVLPALADIVGVEGDLHVGQALQQVGAGGGHHAAVVSEGEHGDAVARALGGQAGRQVLAPGQPEVIGPEHAYAVPVGHGCSPGSGR